MIKKNPIVANEKVKMKHGRHVSTNIYTFQLGLDLLRLARITAVLFHFRFVPVIPVSQYILLAILDLKCSHSTKI